MLADNVFLHSPVVQRGAQGPQQGGVTCPQAWSPRCATHLAPGGCHNPRAPGCQSSPTSTADQHRVQPFTEVWWQNFVRYQLWSVQLYLVTLAVCLLPLIISAQPNQVLCHGTATEFIHLCALLQLTVNSIDCSHAYSCAACLILVYLTGEHKKYMLSDKLKCKGINCHLSF